jgi:cellulose synthase/poly-beta-1,6-N-acetylglucosamine synthase-like glycosyltransferase
VSIVIAARNEGARLPARIKNLLALDYPTNRRQIIVVSDGSDDDTIVRLACYRHVVNVVALPKVGKAAALNAGVARATGDILVFADARQTFAPDALRALTAPFADPTVGGVSGELVLGCETSGGRRRVPDRRRYALSLPANREHRALRWRRSISTIGEGVGFYWQYEKHLRSLESAVGSMLGATGAIYALRRSLWQPLPPGAILDDVLAPMRAVLAGTRIVFEPRARAYDRTSPDADAEMRRKIRTLAGNVEILRFEPRLLVPFVNPVWLQYVSHKVGRLLVPYALVALLVASAFLVTDHPFYVLALAVQLLFYTEAAYGAWLEHLNEQVVRRSMPARIARVAFAVVVMNFSAVAGLAAALSGRSVWR